MNQDARAPVASRAEFPHWTSVSIRFCDQDPLGHVNNAATAAYFEQARVALVYPMLESAGHKRVDIVLARIAIDYLAELGYPGFVEIGTRVVRLGTKSFTLGHGLFKDGGNKCFATAECVLVFFDNIDRVSIAAPPEIRAKLAALG
jgi:acyl-CoA thioester hydrolase